MNFDSIYAYYIKTEKDNLMPLLYSENDIVIYRAEDGFKFKYLFQPDLFEDFNSIPAREIVEILKFHDVIDCEMEEISSFWIDDTTEQYAYYPGDGFGNTFFTFKKKSQYRNFIERLNKFLMKREDKIQEIKDSVKLTLDLYGIYVG